MLRVSLLGDQAITDGRTGTVRARSSRAVVLVAFLVCHAGVPQPRQRISGLLWPESTDAQALTNLRRELHHLRQIMGDEPSLAVTAKELGWRDTTTCQADVRVFDIERKAALEASLSDPATYQKEGAAVAGLRAELEEVTSEVERLYARWQELEAVQRP